MKCEPNIVKYLGITLLPQAGVALGMSLTAAQVLGAEGAAHPQRFAFCGVGL